MAARYLGDLDYGRYSLAYFFAGLLTIFSDLGLNTVLIRDVSRDHRLLGRYAGNILFIKILFSLTLLLLGPGLLFLLGYSRDLILMILLSMVYMQGIYLLDFFVALTNSLEKMEYELLIKGLYKSLVVAIPIFFLWLGYGIWGLLLSLIGAYGISCVLIGMDHLEKDHPVESSPGNEFMETAPSFGLAYRAFQSFYDRLCPNRYGHVVLVRGLPG